MENKNQSPNLSKISSYVYNINNYSNNNSNKSTTPQKNISINNNIPFSYTKKNRARIFLKNFSSIQSPRNTNSTSIIFNSNSDNNLNNSLTTKKNFFGISSCNSDGNISNLKLAKTFNKNLNYKNNSFKFFNRKANERNITAKEIFKYYIKKNEHEEKIKKLLNKLNGKNFFNENNNNILDEIKNNNKIAFKKDFKIQEYQKTLLKILNKKISKENFDKLKNDYKIFNKNNFGVPLPTGRFINFANNLKGHISAGALYKILNFDKNYNIFLHKKEKSKKNKKISLLEEYNNIIALYENEKKEKLRIKKIESSISI